MPKVCTAELTRALSVAKATFPELRVGQIISNAVSTDIFYVSDEVLVKAIWKYISTQRKICQK